MPFGKTLQPLVKPLLEKVVPAVGAAVASVVGPALKIVGHRTRRAWGADGRAHVEVRRVEANRLPELGRAVERTVEAVPGVAWAELNPYTRRVIVAYDERQVSLDDLVAAVQRAEEAADAGLAPFGDEKPEHPADVEPLARTLVEMGTDAGGLVLAAILRMARVPPLPFQTDAATILSVLDSAPSLRQKLDDRLGPLTTELMLNVLSSVTQGLSQGATSLGADIVYRALLVREIQARRRVWDRREPELCRAKAGFSADRPFPDRPIPLPKGPVEKYAERAWYASLGAFGVGVATTGSLHRAFAPMIGCMPKPARLGREAFAAQLGRALALRGVVPMDSRVLRHFDRVDTVVLQADLVATASFSIGEVVHERTVDAAESRRVARSLLDPSSPTTVHRARGWALGPLPLLGVQSAGGLEARRRELASRGALVLGLTRRGALAAIIEVRVSPQTDVEALIRSAHDAGLRVLVATDRPADLERFDADEVVPGGRRLAASVAALQQEGAVVALVASGPGPALRAADVGIGLVREGKTPWGAHLMCPEDLGLLRYVFESMAVARDASKQSTHIALASASLGAFISAGGLRPETGRKVMNVVNVATVVAMANGGRLAAALDWRPPAPLRDPTPWHALDVDGVLARLRTTPAGLTRREAVRRRPPRANPLPEVARLGRAVADELLNPLAPLLAAGAGLSAVVGSLADAGLVAGVMGVNALLGGIQRYDTERSIEALGQRERSTARVRRGGEDTTVPADRLVAGDIVTVRAGDVVPADCRVMRGWGLQVDESTLTGESVPVAKSSAPTYGDEVGERASMIYEGTSVASGHAVAVVVATGEGTEARRGMAAARGTLPHSGVEARLEELMELTAPAVAFGGAAVVGAGLLRGQSLAKMIGSAVSLAVAAVPEGLPIIATAAQLAAARRLSERGALVRNPRAIEALGRVDVVCVDKTGTVTEGRIALRMVTDGVSEEPVGDSPGAMTRAVLATALRACPDGRPDGAPLHAADRALSSAAEAAAVRREEGAPGWALASELPFEPDRGFHAVLSQGGVLSLKGAPEVVLPRCESWAHPAGQRPLDAGARSELTRRASQLARRGLRLLAIAEGPFEGPLADDTVTSLTFRGFVAFADPVRPSAAAAVDGVRRAGVDVIMITGDHPSTAEAIAAELGILDGRGIVTGAELERMSDEALAAVAPHTAAFARTTPAQKVRIVRALQQAKRVVAMTGDGANDAAAIRLADVGIALGRRSTPAARGAADVVVTDDRIETLVDAIVEGRAMWTSVRDAVAILVGGNLGEMGFTILGTLLGGTAPLNARQLLLVNLLTDVAPAMAIALRPPEPTTMEALLHEGPEASLGKALDREIVQRAITTGAGATAGWVLARLTGTRRRASTVALASLVGTQLAQTLQTGRSKEVLAATIGSAALLAAAIQVPSVSRALGCTPLGPVGWSIAAGSTAAATLGSVWLPSFVDRVRARAAADGEGDTAGVQVVRAWRELLGAPAGPAG